MPIGVQGMVSGVGAWSHACVTCVGVSSGGGTGGGFWLGGVVLVCSVTDGVGLWKKSRRSSCREAGWLVVGVACEFAVAFPVPVSLFVVGCCGVPGVAAV